MTTLPQGDLPNDPGILRTAAQHTGKFETHADHGRERPEPLYAAVVQGGVFRRGDPVRLA